MKTITISNFSGGMTTDLYSGGFGEFSTTRNFDILSYPNKLYPLASMAAGTASTGIMNILVASDGLVYGLSNSGTGAVWAVNGSNVWTVDSGYGSGANVSSDFFVNYPQFGSKNILFYDTTVIAALDPVAHASASAATFTAAATAGGQKIGQGFVHPKDKLLYVPYQIAGTTVIGILTGTGDNASHWAPAVLTLPSNCIVTGLTHYGNYLAIATTTTNTGNIPTSVNASVVYLWDRDTSNTLPNETIPWGDNLLQGINNLNGVLVGISKYLDDDNTSLLIKGYSGGEVEVIKEIPAIKQTTTSPNLTINNRVNFIHKNRMYFSADLTGGSTSPTHKGLWSVGKVNGRWSVVVERFASTDGTDVSVLAATFRLGYLYTCHTAAGTLTDNGTISSALATRYASSSIYESLVNPNMPENEKGLKKKLLSFQINTLPLTSSGQVVVKYRVDVMGNSSNWTTVLTKTSTTPDTNLTYYKVNKPASGEFTDGVFYEFRIESTGGVEIKSFSYNYEIKP